MTNPYQIPNKYTNGDFSYMVVALELGAVFPAVIKFCTYIALGLATYELLLCLFTESPNF
jgi:hypothetical protein